MTRHFNRRCHCIAFGWDGRSRSCLATHWDPPCRRQSLTAHYSWYLLSLTENYFLIKQALAQRCQIFSLWSRLNPLDMSVPSAQFVFWKCRPLVKKNKNWLCVANVTIQTWPKCSEFFKSLKYQLQEKYGLFPGALHGGMVSEAQGECTKGQILK